MTDSHVKPTVTIFFRSGVPRTLLPGEIIAYRSGWVIIRQNLHDPDFGDGGFEWSEDIVAYPADLVHSVATVRP